MDEEFFTSLLAAVAAFVGEDAPRQDSTYEQSPFAATLSHFGEKPVTLGIERNAGFAGIREADPAFDIGAFLVHIGEMFSAYHEAVDKGDLAPARRFIDEATYAQLEPTVKKAGRRYDASRVVRVHAIRPMTAKHENGLDVVRIIITAEQTGSPELVCEYWEVVRKHGVATKPDLALTRCPNCGGPVDGLDPSRCDYCGTRLADPGLDWVVRKITPQ